MEASGIPFKEVLIPFDFPAGNPRFREISPVGMVPVLHHGKARIWESLAIIEYVAELYPEAQLWPEDRIERAAARALSAEMHAGFRALRGACPMNFGRKPAPLAVKRLSASDLPASVTLSDSDSMAQGLSLSVFPQVQISARISRTGNAIASSGDLQGQSGPVTVQDTDRITITIDEVVE